ncbi:type IV toxin-antitoxin system YeeU family antitoxin [Pectobacterium parmentieri]|uniref:Type IV toxin-antitoxin system YeeU family antitoxin n=1 Tax=Pectobacterium parmentieri TaxID=1905730 RepID=A0ABS0RYJ4_PECPM|nr:type IV toxin-antitoxin system YeeU family antitoxin [Pectobacterium parmentieri]MBI0471259.1 type IV toxin-antitoxin system YeeU family antitoxin [Pectobacterium parmentieri]MBI0493871.1 type IV toxin-antitoxin system YeeU family antitoxin [Pectobacterium parmentieri]MBI0554707.1 type IV toxin-antitoxin system YeeU family antitoxin [Pectobacterium parmentieri]MBI0568137.1 type IV toxin-antitoxin system YeeU family antitoxin [Pectobacterium parmentieri]MBI0573106.1 type IV toxin-antitoxin s
MSSTETPEWGLKRAVTPRFGARLVQEGNRLHYLADRASIVGTFSKIEARNLERCFPELIKQLEHKLCTGELNPRQQGRVTLHCDEFTCEADTLGSFGYVYIAIYPSSAETQ